jgi:hypothetical protein
MWFNLMLKELRDRLVPGDVSLVKMIRSLLLDDSRDMTIPFTAKKRLTKNDVDNNGMYTCTDVDADNRDIYTTSEHDVPAADKDDEEPTKSNPPKDPGKNAPASSNKRPRSQSDSSSSSSSSSYSSASDNKNSTVSSSSSSSSSLSDMES